MKIMKDMKISRREFSDLSRVVIGSAIEVHRHLGPGLLESTYRHCLGQELASRGVRYEVEHPVALEYKGVFIACAYRIDLFVERQIIVEVKSLDALRSVHEAQVLTYMRLSNAKAGFLINFSARLLVDGLRSFVL